MNAADRKKKELDDKLSELFSTIQIGHKSLMNPPEELKHEFSEYVDKKNAEGDVVINMGRGYYRPFPKDSLDNAQFEDYIEEQYAKANAIIEKCIAMSLRYQVITEKINEKWSEVKDVWEERQRNL